MLCQRSPEGYREYAKILLLNMDFNFQDVLVALEANINSGQISFEHIKQQLIAKGLTPQAKHQAGAPYKHHNLDIPIDSPAKFNYLIGGVAK